MINTEMDKNLKPKKTKTKQLKYRSYITDQTLRRKTEI